MPKKAYDMQSIKNLFHRKVPNATIIPVYELSSKDINRHLLPVHSNISTHYNKKRLPMFLKTWVENFWLKDVTEDELWNYYSHVTQEEIWFC
jgi:hypothetical protein